MFLLERNYINLVNKQLIADEKLREFGDKTIAPYFNQMLEVMKHSKVTSKLNPRHDLQMLMKKNPGEVAKFLKFYDYVNDNNSFKKNKAIQSWVDENLSTLEPEELVKNC